MRRYLILSHKQAQRTTQLCDDPWRWCDSLAESIANFYILVWLLGPIGDPWSGLLHTSLSDWIWYFFKKTPLEPNERSFLSLLHWFLVWFSANSAPSTWVLPPSLPSSHPFLPRLCINHPKDSGKSNPSSLTFIISWWHNVGGLNYPVTRDSAYLKIPSSKQHTAGTICILSWLSWWMFKPSIHVRVQYLLFLLNEFPLYRATTDVSDKNCAPPNQKRLFDLTVGPQNSGSCRNVK